MAELYGSCACERNQYTVIIPNSATSLAQVFFDNSTANRRHYVSTLPRVVDLSDYVPGRTQATPVTAWLRIPLDWYHSTTFALFPDETHNSIRRTFNTPTDHPALPPTRRQFCGYCGTHLTAWNEAEESAADFLDVTLGSLLNESLLKLESLNIIPDTAEDEEALVQGGYVDDEDHIQVNEEGMGGVEGPGARSSLTTTPQQADTGSVRRMQNRGIPYFEEMVENSRLGRIKRQKGGHTSQDGRTTVQWEVVEIDNTESSPLETAAEAGGGDARIKRQKTDA